MSEKTTDNRLGIGARRLTGDGIWGPPEDPATAPTSVAVTGCDSLPVLQQALSAARTFQPMGSSQVAATLARTTKAAAGIQFELYKITPHFDGKVQNPQWLC
jgi:hypothetical protein